MVADIEWLSTSETAALLGLTPRTVYRLINDGELPGYRIGRLVRLQRAHVLEYIEAARIQPDATRGRVSSDEDEREDPTHR